MPMEMGHNLEHTTERLNEGLRCPWKWGQWIELPYPVSLSRIPNTTQGQANSRVAAGAV